MSGNPSQVAGSGSTSAGPTQPYAQHRPANPSQLRQSFSASSPVSPTDHDSNRSDDELAPDQLPSTEEERHEEAHPEPGPSRAARPTSPTENSSLLRNILDESVHEGPCNHGTFSPRPSTPASVGSFGSLDVERPSSPESESDSSIRGTIGSILSGGGGSGSRGTGEWKRRWVKKIKSKKMSTSSALAQDAGIKDSTVMFVEVTLPVSLANVSRYFAYYVPCLRWMTQYKAEYLKGDIIAAITVASFYLPMALSLADNLAHVPPINGLYSFVFNPLMYAILGSSPQMVVGPEAAGSLLVGTIIKNSVDNGEEQEGDEVLQAQICGIIAGMAGAMVFAAGLARLGFLDSVLSRPFLRGFISAIGFVIAVDQLVPEMGLNKAASEAGVNHGSSMEKIGFLIQNAHRAHRMTVLVSAVSFTVIMVLRELKKRLQPRYPGVAYVPDRFLIVVLSAFLCWQLDWESQGVAILGPVKAASGHLFTFRWPFQVSHMRHIREAMSMSFLIALLGFFESSVAAKSLGGSETFPAMQLSANRELVALGAANLVGACFMSLPAFGGYGRSKVNKATGGKSPMSSIFLSLITLLSILLLLPYMYYLPKKPVLSAMISVVAFSLIEECPSDILFFVRIRGFTELGLMAIIFLSTIFYSLSLGIAIGVGLSVLQVIQHSTRPRIQILGRIPGTNRFENAETNPDRLEFFEGCLIVKIPEPLTFANTGELKARLRRLELYGTSMAHPALPRLRREESNRNIIFDIHGVTSLDGSGTQVLEEIVRTYRDRNVRVFFSRGPSNPEHPVRKLMERSGIVDLVGGAEHFVDDVQEALKMSEYEESLEGVVPVNERSPLLS